MTQKTNPYLPSNPPRKVPVLSGESQIESLIAEDSFQGVIHDSIDEVLSIIAGQTRKRSENIGLLNIYDYEDYTPGCIVEETESMLVGMVYYSEKSRKGEKQPATDLIDIVKRKLLDGYLLHFLCVSDLDPETYTHGYAVSKAKGDQERYILAGEELTKQPEERRGVISCDIRAVLSVVDNHWFNINFRDLFLKFPFDKDLILDHMHDFYDELKFRCYPPPHLRAHGPVEFELLDFEHAGNKLKVGINFGYNSIGENANYEENFGDKPKYIRLRGNNMVGPAWNYHDCSGFDQPQIKLSISHSMFDIPEANDKRIGVLRAARDDLLTKIKEALQ